MNHKATARTINSKSHRQVSQKKINNEKYPRLSFLANVYVLVTVMSNILCRGVKGKKNPNLTPL